METMVQQGCNFVGTPQLNHEEWAAPLYGGEHEVIDRNAFAGWIRRVSVYGVAAAAISTARKYRGNCNLRQANENPMFRKVPDQKPGALRSQDWFDNCRQAKA